MPRRVSATSRGLQLLVTQPHDLPALQPILLAGKRQDGMDYTEVRPTSGRPEEMLQETARIPHDGIGGVKLPYPRPSRGIESLEGRSAALRGHVVHALRRLPTLALCLFSAPRLRDGLGPVLPLGVRDAAKHAALQKSPAGPLAGFSGVQ